MSIDPSLEQNNGVPAPESGLFTSGAYHGNSMDLLIRLNELIDPTAEKIAHGKLDPKATRRQILTLGGLLGAGLVLGGCSDSGGNRDNGNETERRREEILNFLNNYETQIWNERGGEFPGLNDGVQTYIDQVTNEETTIVAGAPPIELQFNNAGVITGQADIVCGIGERRLCIGTSSITVSLPENINLNDPAQRARTEALLYKEVIGTLVTLNYYNNHGGIIAGNDTERTILIDGLSVLACPANIQSNLRLPYTPFNHNEPFVWNGRDPIDQKMLTYIDIMSRGVAITNDTVEPIVQVEPIMNFPIDGLTNAQIAQMTSQRMREILSNYPNAELYPPAILPGGISEEILEHYPE